MHFNNSSTRPCPESACANQILHTVRAGDTLFSLANRFNTTVGRILALNPGTDIYNLQIGATLVICPGIMPVPPIGTIPPVTPVPPIGTVPPAPPVMPIPPIGPSLPSEAVRELIMCILRWVRDILGESEARRLMMALTNEIWRN